MTSAVIGERVRHIRNYYGWSQDELARMAGVTQPAISLIERGGGASQETVEAIAKASQFSVEFLLRGPLPDLPKGSIKYRKTSAATVREDKRVRAHVRHTIEALQILSEVAKPPPVRLRPIKDDEEVDGDFIETLASDAREWLGVGPTDPIPNMTRAAERAGVVVIGSADVVGGHQGVSYWSVLPPSPPIIWVTRGLPGDRGRMTIAHELGHLVLHQLRQVDTKKAESEAFRFAGALLIPREAVMESIQTPVTLGHLAQAKARWGIAISALVRRCLDLGLIDVERRTSLEKQLSSRGWRKTEPVEVPTESPVLMRRLMEKAFGTAEPRRAARPIGVPPIATRDLVA
jgi:Zn-dependent peptidase ImmA (M78 family)/transcriptional regulator with XRE-family HTH domain